MTINVTTSSDATILPFQQNAFKALLQAKRSLLQNNTCTYCISRKNGLLVCF